MENKLSKVVERLEELFELANERFFDGSLPEPVVTVSSDNNKNAYGWCTTWKAWKGTGENGFYEINISAEYLDRELPEVVATMIHEMVHLDNLEKGIQDTSRSGQYHNKKFKETAEKKGLLIERCEKNGWTITNLSFEGMEFVQELKEDGWKSFEFKRDRMEKVASKKGKSNSRKYVCPECGTIVRATKEVNVMCGDCEVHLEEEIK